MGTSRVKVCSCLEALQEDAMNRYMVLAAAAVAFGAYFAVPQRLLRK
jgi:hypothetical protein